LIFFTSNIKYLPAISSYNANISEDVFFRQKTHRNLPVFIPSFTKKRI